MPTTSSPCRAVILATGIVLATLGQSTPVSAGQYWVAPDGDDRLDGTSRRTAWASPSRGQPTRTHEPVTRGGMRLPVYSTEGFLDSGRLRVGKLIVNYVARTEREFVLAGPWPEDTAAFARVYDADLLGGRSFAPGDVILLAGGEWVDRPLHFCQPGTPDHPITYRPAPGHRPRLVSTRYNRSPVRHLGSRRSPQTTHVVLSGLDIRNAADGNHGAAGLDLIGLGHALVSDCRIHISGRDLNGDNNAIRLLQCDHVTIANCRLHSRFANAVAAWNTTATKIDHCVIYECFQGISASGAPYVSDLDVDHCTIYASHRYGALGSESSGRVRLTNSIVAQMGSLRVPALTGHAGGDHNCLWHVAVAYGKGYNGDAAGRPGPHDIQADPQFISRDPRHPLFLRIPTSSPAATAAADGGYLGAFKPVPKPAAPDQPVIDVREFGARGDGKQDDAPAIQAAVRLAEQLGGGRVVVPATREFYLLGSTIRIRGHHVTLTGPGARLKLKDAVGRIHLLHIGGDGPTRSVAEHIEVSGLLLDGNYRSQPQQRAGGLPRCVWVEHAGHVVIRDLEIRDAWCGVSLAINTRDCLVENVTVTDWDHDAFGASGWGINGGCTDVKFLRCRAVDTPRCVKAWEIEEGAQRILLEDCVVENLGGTGTGFYVRHHGYRWPVLVDDVTFRRCRASRVNGDGFRIATSPGPQIRPWIRTRNIRLLDCQCVGRTTIAWGVEDVLVQGGRFDGPVCLGFAAGTDPPEGNGTKGPVRSVTLRGTRIGQLLINSRIGNPTGKLGDTVYPDYVPRIRLLQVRQDRPARIIGEGAKIEIRAGSPR